MKEDDTNETTMRVEYRLVTSKDARIITLTVKVDPEDEPLDTYNYLGILQQYIDDERAKDPNLMDPDDPKIIHH